MRSADEILNEVKTLAVEYYELTGKPLGVTGEIAEAEAARLLGLRLADARSPGYDAEDIRMDPARRLQIKGRWKSGGKTWGRVPSINCSHEFDAVLLVLLSGHYEVVEIWEADRAAVIARLKAPGSKARNERNSMGVSQFKTIATRVWPA
ncbi:DUF6998 domain-containing protein [Rhodobacter maris]|uniref:DUF6998 domain-containing protein n=1 Tax=Rhodobacter maris TaxID=446682 RepID=A0A285TB57_9RHOB|nr:hypothetical protein [Rhodobacter maris]SOC18900.1 hypothetical protein SAMN05877831_11731 [Rhodobacter maris]